MVQDYWAHYLLDHHLAEAEEVAEVLERAEGPDMRLTLVKGADHRFSSPDDLAHITAAITDVLVRAEG